MADREYFAKPDKRKMSKEGGRQKQNIKMAAKKLIIIGGGNMGYAIADGISKKRIFTRENILFVEKKIERIKHLKNKRYFASNNLINIITKNKRNIEAIILAVKPNDFSESISPLKKSISKDTLIISIMAGVKIQSIESQLGKSQPIARVMPNTPCQIAEGISALSYNQSITNKKKKIIRRIFTSIGEIADVKENDLDTVTAISGSGPAYFCYILESMIDAGIKLGLNNKLSDKLVIQTAKGTLLLLKNRGLSPEKLRESVTSPRGTTEAALKIFKKQGLDKIIFSGIKSAKDRGTKLGKLNK